MKITHPSTLLPIRWGSGAMALLATATLATQVAGDEDRRTLAMDITTASGMAPAPAGGIQAAQPAPTTYTRRFGTPLNDSMAGIAPDNLGNVYIAGNSSDTGDNSGFLRKYSPTGTLLWEKTKAAESIDGVTVDNKGNAYIAGSYATGTSLSTRHYVYLEKYDTDGNLLWMKFFKAAPASDPTRMIVNGISTDPSGNGFVILLFERAFWPYQTREVYIRKYTASGTPIWEKPAGTSSPYTSRPVLATDNQGRIYTAINSASNQRWNTKISQFNNKGDSVWSNFFHSTASVFETYVHCITVDPSGSVYVGGITKANLEGPNSGYYDAFIRKHDNTGAILWTKQFGTIANDYVNSLTTDSAGDLYAVGSTSGVLDSSKNLGSFDAIVRKYTGNGDLLRSRQFGTTEFDIANAVRHDAGGYLYVAGHSYGNLGGSNKGGQDLYFRKFTAFQ